MHARNPFFIVFALLLYSALSACASTSPTHPPSDSAASKASVTVAVPEDAGMLAQGLRRSLTQRGWTLAGYDATTLRQTRDYASLARRARYRLTLSSDRIGDCRSGDPSFLYNLAMVENLTGDVALALTGATCLATAVGNFEAGLDRKGLIVPAAVNGR